MICTYEGLNYNQALSDDGFDGHTNGGDDGFDGFLFSTFRNRAARFRTVFKGA